MEQQQQHKGQRTQPQLPSHPPPHHQQQQHHQQHHQQPKAAPYAASGDPSRAWLPEVVHHFASFLHGNELACTLRLVNKATAAQFREPQHTTVQLSLPVPHHAFAWSWGGSDATRSLTVRQQLQLPCLTMRSGSIANLEVLLARDDLTSPLDALVMEATAGAGQLEVCRWLRLQGCRWNSGAVFNAAAGAGHEEMCEWLLAEGCPFSADVMRHAAGGGHWADVGAATAAARGGHVGLLDWILARTHAQSPANVRGLLAAAAVGCDLPTLQRLHHTYLDSRGEELSGHGQKQIVAAAAGSPTADWRDKVEWLEGRGCPRTSLACEEAAARRADSRGRLEWLQQRGYPITVDAVHSAARHGNADALEFLLAQGVEVGEHEAYVATCHAVDGGHLAVLKVLHAHGARVGRMMERAAAFGHLPVVAWGVQELGAALSAGMYKSSARSGSAELVTWLHEQGCPWDASVFAAAAGSVSETQLEWLAERGCPMGDDGAPYWWALWRADLAALHCLRRLGCPWGPVGCTFTAAVRSCCRTDPMRRKQLLLALPWLVEQGCPVGWGAAEGVAEEANDGGEVLAWVRQQRCSVA
ncbi:Ankyrin repeat domain-containing protein [Tetrabaena socialis]|uniref:Ankyrin repeat domain-containing protein n=1 Tax=Tetrabaena socialis TaxID=47790 RepID=A0A2J7ZL31_9CHLO|nr:Ankyrin repeat domain-containing protein [Tetrabaena socialis]|eukprot:PNH00979.1 Ankyrin repeat domain-containing protein [Tetrabaena socialis]